MVSKKTRVIILLTFSFVLLFLTSYLAKGLALALIFAIYWVDKVLLAQLKIQGEFGIELWSMPVILSGIIYGPYFGFMFGFLICAVVGGILSIISWQISPPMSVGWPPLVPSMDNLIVGIMGAMAGFLRGYLSFFFVVFVCIIFRSIVFMIKHYAAEEPKISPILNVGFNLLLAFYLQGYFLAIIGV